MTMYDPSETGELEGSRSTTTGSAASKGSTTVPHSPLCGLATTFALVDSLKAFGLIPRKKAITLYVGLRQSLPTEKVLPCERCLAMMHSVLASTISGLRGREGFSGAANKADQWSKAPYAEYARSIFRAEIAGILESQSQADRPHAGPAVDAEGDRPSGHIPGGMDKHGVQRAPSLPPAPPFDRRLSELAFQGFRGGASPFRSGLRGSEVGRIGSSLQLHQQGVEAGALQDFPRPDKVLGLEKRRGDVERP